MRAHLLLSLLIPSLPLPAQERLVVADPAASGCDAAALRQAAAGIEQLVTENDLRGAVVLVTRGTSIVLHEAYGCRDVAGEQPMQKDTLFRMASNTKAVTAAAILHLVERGKVGLDDPASRWFGTFGSGKAAAITVHHLLTHTSGLTIGTLFVQPLMQPSERHPDAPNLVLECARFGEIGPTAAPGSSYSYSNPGYNTLAGIVTLAGEREFEAYCREAFYRPLGMADTCNLETRADLSRMSAVMVRAADGSWRARWQPGDAPTLPFVRGSGGLITTAVDYAKFARLFVTGGVAGERRILSEDSVARMTGNRIPHLKGRSYGYGWGIAADGSFSHTGSDGTMVWCDPARDLVGMVLTQTQRSKRLGPARSAFRKAVAAACPVLRPQKK
ncbi:MAG: serine hydrolase domain-containing protein [Planctomycetota bacterium]|jgi:CubicO group peptidase (beta-lactamase class C family)